MWENNTWVRARLAYPHGFHPEDDEVGTLQVLGEQFSLFYAL